MTLHATAPAAAATGKTLKRHPKCSSFFAVGARSASHEDAERVTPLSPSIAYLKQLSMQMTVSKALKGGPQYAMTVYHKKTKATWRHCRDFEEYKAFQTRLVATMQRGHFCFAECPWLFTFVKRSFPKPSFFNYASPRVVELRRKALNTFFNTLQAVLLNRANHCCSVLTEEVAKEFVGFIYGDVGNAAPWEHFSPVARGGILARTFSETFMSAAIASSSSSLSSTSDEESGDDSTSAMMPGLMIDDHHSEERECCAMCALHQVRSDEQVFAWWQSKSRFEKTKALAAGSSSSASSGASTARTSSRSSSGADSPFSSSSRYTHSHNFQHSHYSSSTKKLHNNEPTPRDASNNLTLVSEPGESPLFSLAETAVLGDREIAVLGGDRHDGTPKEAYPGTPKSSFHSTSLPSSFPSGWTTSSLSSPPPQLSFLRDDDDGDKFFAANARAHDAKAQAKRERAVHSYHSVPTPTFLNKRIRTLPRRSLNVISCMSNALSNALKPSPTTTF